MIRNYLELQVSMLHRQMRAFGLAPIYAYTLGLIAFLLFSYLLFAKSTYAPYVYGLLGLATLSPLSLKERNDFLRICFHKNDFRRLRLSENLLVTSPFLVYLIIEGAYLPALGLLLGSLALAVLPLSATFVRVLPTPFGRRPFEFPIGFRQYFWLIALLYFVAIMGFSVHNFSLVVFTIVALFAVCSSFYSPVEPYYYVWIYHFRSKDFLLNKLRTGLLFSSLLALPLMVAALVYFIEHVWIIFLAWLIGLLFLTAVLLAKYSVFPRKTGLPEALLLTAGVVFPPFLLWLLYYFFRKGKENLKTILS